MWNPLVFVSSCQSQQVARITKSLSGRMNVRKPQSNRGSPTQLQGLNPHPPGLWSQSYAQFLASSSPQLCKETEVLIFGKGRVRYEHMQVPALNPIAHSLLPQLGSAGRGPLLG